MKKVKLCIHILARFVGFCLVLSVPPTLVVTMIYLLLGAPLNVLVAYGYWLAVNLVVNGVVIYMRTSKKKDKLEEINTRIDN